MNIDYIITKHNEKDNFEKVRDYWKSINAKTGNSTPYMDPDRYIVTAPRFKGFKRFFVRIECDKDHSPCNLAAFFIQKRPVVLKFGSKKMHLPFLSGNFLSTINEGLLWTNAEAKDSIISFIADCLKRKEIDGLHFQFMLEENALNLIDLLKTYKLYPVITNFSKNWIVQLNGKNIKEPFMRLRSKVRNNVKRKEKKLKKTYKEKIKFSVITSEKQIDFFFHSIDKITKNCWQRKFNRGIIDNDIWRSIYKLEASHKRLRCYILFADSVPISYIFGTIYDNIYNCEVVAYNQKYAEYSPGILLLKHAVSDLLKIKIKEYDFGGGDEKYKAEWGTFYKPMINFEVYGGSLFSIFLWAIKKVNRNIESFLKKILLNIKLLERLNKWDLQKQRHV